MQQRLITEMMRGKLRITYPFLQGQAELVSNLEFIGTHRFLGSFHISFGFLGLGIIMPSFGFLGRSAIHRALYHSSKAFIHPECICLVLYKGCLTSLQRSEI